MREIKTRVWSVKNKEWITDYQILPDGRVWGADEDAALMDVEVMQYTGLHSAKGVQIFEGDILRFSIKGKKQDWRTCAVSWGDVDAGFYCGGYALAELIDAKIIGNVFEHPELLK